MIALERIIDHYSDLELKKIEPSFGAFFYYASSK